MRACCFLINWVLLLIVSVSCGQSLPQKERLRARFPAPKTESTHRVWIDTDPSVGTGGHEVDDGLALIQAFHSPELEIRGVSAVFGNAELAVTFPITAEITGKFAPGTLKVFKGASGPAELGLETDASRALAAALEKEKLTILALGPVTNVATVLLNRPELADQIRQIVAVAGRRPNQPFVTGSKRVLLPDLNFELDPQAFQVLLDSPVSLVLAPWEVSSKVRMEQSDIEKLAEGGSGARWIFQPVFDWLNYWEREFGATGFNPFDTLAVGFLTHPLFFKLEELPIQIQNLPDDGSSALQPEGPVSQKPYLIVSIELEVKRRAHYCFDVSPRFKEVLLERLKADG